ncbi:MAG TPA: hypothetical protein PLH97_07330, partial [Verrucomicrobiota bacterium]|nr:hypothetical protein [Verrucomicrobiota bacterium]
NEGSLVQALNEVNGATQVFEQAGYELTGVDMELSPNQRLIVHLARFEVVDQRTLQSLLRANQHAKTVHGILWSLIRAEEMAAQVDVTNMVYRELIVHVGPIPSVRMSWGYAEEEEEEAPVAQPAPVQTTVVSGAAPASASAPTQFAQTTFFESRSVPQPQGSAAVASTATSDVSATTTVAPAGQAEESREMTSADWRRDALERLKKNPHVSKYQRRF